MQLQLSNALLILDVHAGEIHTVAGWAERAGYKDPKYFSHLFRSSYGMRPKNYIQLKKLQRFNDLITKKSPLLHYEIALELGLPDELGLYKYIMRHTGKSPSFWRGKGGLPNSLFFPLKGIEKILAKV